jgi:hypothetical protein
MKKKLLLLCIVAIYSISSYGQSGQIGDIFWNISDGVLTISGTGEIPSDITWHSYHIVNPTFRRFSRKC